MDGDIRRNSYDDGSVDIETGEQRIHAFNFGRQGVLPGDEKKG